MPLPPNISELLAALRKGDAEAADLVWVHFFENLCRVAQKRLADRPLVAADGEDVALSALGSAFRRLQAGEFPDVATTEELRRLLVTITRRKAATLIRNETRQKRGGGRRPQTPSSVPKANEQNWLESIVSAEQTPEAIALAADAMGLLFLVLDEPGRQVALLKLEGYRNQEISARLGWSLSTVERKLKQIRATWASAIDDGPSSG
jgi:DNA-directed RNA polymerase specialized sigma24 family protein